MKILVTDDSITARKMTIKAIRENLEIEHEVIEASNGQEAFDLYKEKKPNVVFMDLTMPVMDGFETISLIKTFDNSAIIVVISADIQKQAIKRAIDLGAFNFIKKPIDSKKMRRILSKLIVLG